MVGKTYTLALYTFFSLPTCIVIITLFTVNFLYIIHINPQECVDLYVLQIVSVKEATIDSNKCSLLFKFYINTKRRVKSIFYIYLIECKSIQNNTTTAINNAPF